MAIMGIECFDKEYFTCVQRPNYSKRCYEMTKDMIWVLFKVTIGVLIIGLLNYYLISGINLSMQIGFVLLGILIILNIFFYQSKKRIEKVVK